MTPDALRLPPGWELIAGADTGTYCSCVIAAVSPDPAICCVLYEIPNYRYVAGEYELLGLSSPQWAGHVVSAWQSLTSRDCHAWADPNTQFREDLAHYGLRLLSNRRGLELRTEITREYFQHERIWLAPWLTVLPYELEQATWPNDTTAARFTRTKQKDHTLDCLEHLLSRRPRGKQIRREEKRTFLDQFLSQHRAPSSRRDPHLGRL